MTRKENSPTRRNRRDSPRDFDTKRRKDKDYGFKRERSFEEQIRNKSPSRRDRSSRKTKEVDNDYKHDRKRHEHSRDHSDRIKHRKRERSNFSPTRNESLMKLENFENSEHRSSKRTDYDTRRYSPTQHILRSDHKEENFFNSDNNSESTRKRKRESKWGTGQAKVPMYLNSEDAEVYSIQIQLNSVTTKLTQRNYAEEIEAMCREPSPDPVYNHEGKRINTKEFRARERLDDRKRNLILRLHALRPELVPHADKMIGARIEERIFIPQEDYPDINFAGLIIGPRGMTQKELEKETGTKILIRGKGSAKPGQFNGDGAPLPGEDEPLHAYVTSMSRESVDKAAEKIRKIIQDGIEFPELQNDLRKNQMKQLAIFNGTYRETEGLNKLKILGEAQSIVTNTIICSLCGGTGHLPRDCLVNSNLIPMMHFPPQHAKLEGEYDNFINELGVDGTDTKPAFLGFIPQHNSGNTTQGTSSFVKNFIFRN